MSWFNRLFSNESKSYSLEINPKLIEQGESLENEQKIQTNLVRLQGRELREQMITSALEIRQRREQ